MYALLTQKYFRKYLCYKVMLIQKSMLKRKLFFKIWDYSVYMCCWNSEWNLLNKGANVCLRYNVEMC